MKIRSKIPPANSGMSLLEVLIALSILAVGLLGIAALQITAIKGNATADETAVATYYAQEKLEEFRRTPFDNVSSSPHVSSGGPIYSELIPTIDNAYVKLSKKGVRIYRVWFVENNTATLKNITVWSCWQEGGVRWHSFRFVTRKGNLL